MAVSNRGAESTDGRPHAGQNSQTAQDFINDQLQLEADAREALPYAFDTCTRPLGPLRQILFSCLTCNPPPTDPDTPYTPAGVCYSCSISCHGEHELVELFNKRNFVCDCGTTRISSDNSCTLRISERTGLKGDVKGEAPAPANRYNHNFSNKFCGCGEIYDPHVEKGTMFQCIGLGQEEDGGCGEDWWHPECLVGLPRKWYEAADIKSNGDTTEREGEEPPLPPGFPEEESFESLICYKCVDSHPWLKSYAGADGFLPALPYHLDVSIPAVKPKIESTSIPVTSQSASVQIAESNQAEIATPTLKRKASEDLELETGTKKSRSRLASPATTDGITSGTACKLITLPPPPTTRISLFLKEDFRDHLCRCPSCFPHLSKYPVLLEPEETYEPPLSSVADSEDGDPAANRGGGSVGSKSLLDRGEAALSNMDRVRAIEGVMAYNHLKEGLKGFLKPFAEEGRAVDAESIKTFFERLRGDAEGIREAAKGAGVGNSGGGDQRREQGGY